MEKKGNESKIIAAQTLSEYTACAMEFFLKAGYEEFKDAAATRVYPNV